MFKVVANAGAVINNLSVSGSHEAIAMKTFTTGVVWTIGAILCVAASAGITAGFWFADREHFHLLDDCVYVHNFTAGGAIIPTFVVSVILVASGVLVWLLVTLVVNRRATGSCFQTNSRWLLACFAFIAFGITGWFAFADWAGRIAAEALFRPSNIQAVDDR